MIDQGRERLRKEIFGSNVQSNPPKQTLRQLISPARLKRIKAKELRRYALRQDAKWVNWFHSMEK